MHSDAWVQLALILELRSQPRESWFAREDVCSPTAAVLHCLKN